MKSGDFIKLERGKSKAFVIINPKKSSVLPCAEKLIGELRKCEIKPFMDTFAEKLEQAIDEFGEADNTLILADLSSGTPSNTAMLMVMKRGVHALSGYNLPALLEILTLREEMNVQELISAGIEAGREGFISADDVIKERSASE